MPPATLIAVKIVFHSETAVKRFRLVTATPDTGFIGTFTRG